ncbi:phage integrase family protein [Cylindrospermum sp. NIES-4074]|nr:phage integrase family protein [Cylindrospermum sp. NIES-4074]
MAVTSDPKSKKLIIRFRVTGYSKQFYLNSGLKNSAKNRTIVDSRWELIQREISLGQFDATLERYRFGSKPPLPEVDNSKTIIDLWERFTDFQTTQLEATTILLNYANTKKRILKFPSQDLADAPKIRDWILSNYSPRMAWDLLAHVNRCCKWSVLAKLIATNPFENLTIKRPKRKSTDDDRRAYNPTQRDLIINAFETNQRFSHYAPLIKFLFWTGCRHGEAFALRWEDISEDSTKISIFKSCNTFGISKGTKNGKRRIFPCQPGGKLNLLLLEMRNSSSASDELIFKSRRGHKLTTNILGDCWRQSSTSPGVVRELSQRGMIHYLCPYATRHTFATCAIASGASPDKVAYWIGDTTATVLQFYCHPEAVVVDCPDF